MSLREELARRLFTAAPPMPHSEFSPEPLWENLRPSSDPGVKEQYYKLSDECIRQMEWARCGCGIRVMGGEPITGHFTNQGEQIYRSTLTVVPELTLAPEDWKP